MTGRTPLYVGTNGIVAALDPHTGEELWRTKLPKCGGVGEVVSMVLKDGYLFAGANGRVWCLSKTDGSVLWQNGLPKMGYHAVLLAMEGAEGGTAYEPAAESMRRRHQQRAAGGSAGAAT